MTKKNGLNEEVEEDLPNIIGQKVSSWFDLPDGKEAKVEGSIIAIKLRKKGKRQGAYYHVKWTEKSIGEEWVHQSELGALLKQTAENLDQHTAEVSENKTGKKQLVDHIPYRKT